MRRPSFSCQLSCLVLGLCLGVACDRTPSGGPGASAEDEQPRDPVTGLSELEAAEVLATVGDRKITLGQYAQSLARMDRFERVRYQSEERQLQLLQEMIEVEVLAQEARRRGLDRDPAVQLQLMQALRNEVLADLERDLPGPETIAESELRQYYDSHRDDFVEPERRRVMVIKLATRELAEKVAQKAQGADGKAWAELAAKYSKDRSRLGPKEANELAGDLGFVSAPGTARGANEAVPPPVRQAVFQLENVGEVFSEPVPAEGSYFVVRMGGSSKARERTFRDAQPAIRAELQRRKFARAREQLLADLAKRYPAKIDEAALERAGQDQKK